MHVNFGAITTCQAGKLIDVESARTHICQRHATVEQILRKPSPRSFPEAFGVDGQRIQRHDKPADLRMSGVVAGRIRHARGLEAQSTQSARVAAAARPALLVGLVARHGH